MKKLSLNECVEYSNGLVNHDATIEAVTNLINNHNATVTEKFAAVAPAVSAEFDKCLGATITKSALKTLAAMTLGAGPTNLTELENMVNDYIEVNSGLPETGALFTISKGKGVQRNTQEDNKARSAK